MDGFLEKQKQKRINKKKIQILSNGFVVLFRMDFFFCCCCFVLVFWFFGFFFLHPDEQVLEGRGGGEKL